jgi:hypothetical protein
VVFRMKSIKNSEHAAGKELYEGMPAYLREGSTGFGLGNMFGTMLDSC